jgi:hypothetical protein
MRDMTPLAARQRLTDIAEDIDPPTTDQTPIEAEIAAQTKGDKFLSEWRGRPI